MIRLGDEKRSKTFQERKPWVRRFQSVEGHRVGLVTEVKAGVGRRWLEGMAGEGDSGETVKALQVRGIWIFADWMKGHLVNEASAVIYVKP